MTLIEKLPEPPEYFNEATKQHYINIGESLITANVLKITLLPTLEVLAQNMAQYEFALKEINRKNNIEAGSGYIQSYKTGNANVSAEVTLKEKAEKNIYICIKLFGLDPKSEKDLGKEEKKEEEDIFKLMGLTK
jgi:phage terminase small subunit